MKLEQIELLETKIKAATQMIRQLRGKNLKITDQYKKLQQENELLLSENRQVRRLMAELDHLREERKLIKQKCERLLTQYEKMNI